MMPNSPALRASRAGIVQHSFLAYRMGVT